MTDQSLIPEFLKEVSDSGIEIIDEQHLATANATIVQLTLIAGMDIIVAKGDSRRCKGDPPDKAIGYTLAYQRALEDAARRMAKRARRLLAEQDYMLNVQPIQHRRSRIFHEAQRRVAGVDSPDARVQTSVIRAIRESEGSWDNDADTKVVQAALASAPQPVEGTRRRKRSSPGVVRLAQRDCV